MLFNFYISTKVSDNWQFELPTIDENFAFRFLSTLEHEATGWMVLAHDF